MQATDPRRDTRLRECLSKIIQDKGINDISKIDFSAKIFDGMSIGEIKEAIEAEKNKSNCPYVTIANKFLKDGNYYDPFTMAEKDGWKPLSDMLYETIQHKVHRAYQSFFLWSSVEIWQMVIYKFGAGEAVYGLKTTIKNEPQRYFYWKYTTAANQTITECNFDIGAPGSTGDNLSKAKTVSGSLVQGQARFLKDSPQIPISEESKPLHEVCKYILLNYH